MLFCKNPNPNPNRNRSLNWIVGKVNRKCAHRQFGAISEEILANRWTEPEKERWKKAVRTRLEAAHISENQMWAMNAESGASRRHWLTDWTPLRLSKRSSNFTVCFPRLLSDLFWYSAPRVVWLPLSRTPDCLVAFQLFWFSSVSPAVRHLLWVVNKLIVNKWSFQSSSWWFVWHLYIKMSLIVWPPATSCSAVTVISAENLKASPHVFRHMGQRRAPPVQHPVWAVRRRHAGLWGSVLSRKPRVLLPVPEGQSSATGLWCHHSSKGSYRVRGGSKHRRTSEI